MYSGLRSDGVIARLEKLRIKETVLLPWLLTCVAWAQLPMGGSGSAGSNRATAVPISGRTNQAGAANAQQSTTGDGVTSSIQISGVYQGSVPGANVPNGPITLTLADAVERGLKFNLGTISADEETRAARAERIQAVSALLPSISANASETVTQVNLAAYGLQIKVPGFNIPTVVGPYSYSQLQGAVSQSVFDPVQTRNLRASRESERASVLSAKDSREVVVLAVGGMYLQTVAAAARVVSQRAQVENAQAVYQQAVVRKAAGINARIDVTRTLVELETQQQRLSALTADLRKQKITLARLIGLSLDRELTLSQRLSSTELKVADPNTMIERAWKSRSDLKAAEAQVRAAEQSVSAAHAEYLPSVSLNGDYGVIGPNPAHTHGVFAVTGSVNIPIWQGGRTKGDIQQAESALRQRRAELADQRARVEQDVRTALIELETASGLTRPAKRERQ
jgi:outer membrane protein TolC